MPDRTFRFLISLSLLACAMSAQAVDGLIDVSVKFHIVTGLPMVKHDLTMSSWIEPSEIQNIILPEINRIWQPAGIRFSASAIVKHQALNPPNRDKLIRSIANARRDSSGKSDPKRIKKLNRLIDESHHQPKMVNVYFVPYLGEKSQGNASRKRLRIFVGQWSDKASKNSKAPQKFQLVEPLPFRKGSLSRTTAHELGHLLGLRHPDKNTQIIFGRLMGGRKAGYLLTREEIAIARESANNL